MVGGVDTTIHCQLPTEIDNLRLEFYFETKIFSQSSPIQHNSVHIRLLYRVIFSSVVFTLCMPVFCVLFLGLTKN